MLDNINSIIKKFPEIKSIIVTNERQPYFEVITAQMLQCRCPNPWHHLPDTNRVARFYFETLTAAGVKKQGEEFAYHFITQEAAEEAYLKEFENYLKEKIKEPVRLVWRKMPEIVTINNEHCFGYLDNNARFYPPKPYPLFNVVSRLVIYEVKDEE